MPFSSLLEKNFTGRDHELEALYGVALEASEEISSSILLSGQHGIGKTELLRQLFNRLFWKQDKVAPFYYAVNPALISSQLFSEDYLNTFIRQRLAFQTKETSLVHADELSIEDLMQLAEKSEAYWAVDIIQRYHQSKSAVDKEKLFLCAISAPYHSYLSSGMPVIVIIDEFQKTRELYGFNQDNKKNLWMLFEGLIKSMHTPHIFTGSQAELLEMFFQETTLGKSLELSNLSGLEKSTSLRLFTTLCDSYNITVDNESLSGFIDLFKGNPFYIRNFIQAVRQEGKTLSENDLWTVYFNEITSGKIYTCWVARLRRYMPKHELRRSSLELLYYLCDHSPSTLSNLKKMLSISTEEISNIINLFYTAGIIEIGFSTFKLVEDEALSHVIKALYSKEVLEEPLSRIEELLIKERAKPVKTAVDMPSFEITIPSTPKAELIAIKALEQIAKNHNISTEVTGELQTALIDLFTNIIAREMHGNENFNLRFQHSKDTFMIEVKTPYKELVSPLSSESASEEQLIRRFVDNIKFEKAKSGTKIILIKNLKKNLASAS